MMPPITKILEPNKSTKYPIEDIPGESKIEPIFIKPTSKIAPKMIRES